MNLDSTTYQVKENYILNTKKSHLLTVISEYNFTHKKDIQNYEIPNGLLESLQFLEEKQRFVHQKGMFGDTAK